MEEIQKLDFGEKIENGGSTELGRLSAAEFMQFVGGHNDLVDVVNEIMNALNDSSDYQTDLHIENNLDSKAISTQSGDKCVIKYTFVSRERYGSMAKYTPTGEQGKLEISVKNNAYSEYTVVKTMYVSSGTINSVEISEYLTSGDNLVMFKCTGQVTEKTTPAFVYTVKSTSLSISAPTFQWWSVFSGENIILPLLIGGNINKKLIVDIIGDGYHETYTENLGASTHTDTPLNYSIQHPGKAGVFNVSAYVENSDGTIRTKVISYNIICVTESDKDGKYLVINNVAENAVNWSVNTLFDYSIYDGDSTITSVIIDITKDGDSVYSSDNSSTPTKTKHTFSMSMEIETIDDTNFEIMIDMLDGDKKMTDTIKLNTNNSLGFSSSAGACLYINPKKRSNNQSNYTEYINEVDGSVIPSVSTNVNYNNDGWVTNDNGVNIRRQLAGSNSTVKYYPFEKECARTGKTIEIKFRAYNIIDYDSPFFTILSETTDINGVSKKVGIRVDADQAIMYSSSNQIEDNQSYALDEGVDIHLTFVVMPDVYGYGDFNIVYMYLNGKKCREFNYESNDYFVNNAPIVIGSDGCDVDLYGIRVYDSALNSSGVMKNYVNWMDTTAEKTNFQEENDLYDDEGTVIDYYKAKLKHNVCVFSSIIPSKLYPSSQTGTMEFFFIDHPQNNLSITNFKISGQGSSSKLYWLWNWKGKIDKVKSVITYADGSTTTKKCKMFPNKPDISIITAKLNWASQSQDRKMGTCALYNDIFKEIGLTNDAINDNSAVRIAIYQEPFVMYEKSINEEGSTVYTYRGEYTIGYDKGDPQCFGFDTSKFPNLLAIEGSDNSPLPTLFKVPWTTDRVTYNSDEEAFMYNNALCYDVNAGNEENISAFIPAYNFVHSCSDLILPFNGTLTELNAQMADFRETGRMYWIAKSGDENQYNVYYYEAETQTFEPDDCGDGCINLKQQLVDKGFGLTSSDIAEKTPDELNSMFILARKVKFKNGLADYFDIEDSLLHSCWVEFSAGTDQRAKNTYLYNFGTLGSKWKWRIDDTDTIWETDNQGLLKKKYSCEVQDKYTNGKPVWNGAENVFWNLLEDKNTFKTERDAMMVRMLAAMESLGGLKSGTSYDKIYACYTKYYVTNGKNKFPAVLVNEQAKFYELAKLQYINGVYTNDTDPISQVVGDCYYPDTSFVKKRINYICSKYNYGFYTAKSSDSISVRAAGTLIKYKITPAVDMYVSIGNGESVINAGRTFAGEEKEVIVNLGGSSDQQNNILGASYLMDIGDWHDKQVVGTLSIKGKMLRNLTLGSKTEDIVIAIDSLSISDCGSLQNLNISNISTLSGVLKLSSCTHIKNIYAKGTSISQIILPDGGGLELIEYPATTQYLMLKNFPVLNTSGVDISDCMSNITDFYISDCPNLNPAAILNDIVNAQKTQGDQHVLKRVRAVWRNEVTFNKNGSEVLDNLSCLSDGTYVGLDSSGLAGSEQYPVLDGKMSVKGNCYEDTIGILKEKFPKLILNITGGYYVRFEDAEVERICVENWGDGKGITMKQIKSVTTIGTVFSGTDCNIKYFDEFKYFTGLTALNWENRFYNNKNILKLTVPETINYIDSYGWCNDASFGRGSFNSETTLTFLCRNMTQFNLSTIVGTLIMYSEVPPTVSNHVWTPTKALFVPYESLEAYKTASIWSNSASVMKPFYEDLQITDIKLVDYAPSAKKIQLIDNYDVEQIDYIEYKITEGEQYCQILDDIIILNEGVDGNNVTINAYDFINQKYFSKTFADLKYESVQQLESVEISGDIDIDTGIIPSTDLTMEVKVKTDKAVQICGAAVSWNGNNSFFIMRIGRNIYRFSNGGNKDISMGDKNPAVLKLSDGLAMIDDTEYTTNNTSGYTNNSIHLFTQPPLTTWTEPQFSGTFYYFRLYKADELIMEIVPMTNGLYDTVAKKYMYIKNYTQDEETFTISIVGNSSYTDDFTLSVNSDPDNTKYKDVTWSITSGSDVASIDSNGNVTIVEGTENKSITVKAVSTYDSLVSTTKIITVSKKETFIISINGESSYSDDFTLSINSNPDNDKYKTVTWSISSGSEYASIDNSGNVTIVEGTDNKSITVKAISTYDSSVSTTKNITVTKKAAVVEEDTVLDYATFDGASYIDTGYLPNINTKVEIKFNVTNTSEHSILGRRTSNGSTDSFVLQHLSSSGVRVSFNKKQVMSSSLSANTDYIVSVDKTEMVVNETSYSISQSSLDSSNYTMYLGNLNNGGTLHSAYFTGNIYYLKIWESDELKMNLVPINKDGVIQFKDTVSGTYYTNKGTGTLTN